MTSDLRPFRCLYCRRLVTDQTNTCPGCGATEFKDVEQEAIETGRPVRVIADLVCKAPGHSAVIKLPD